MWRSVAIVAIQINDLTFGIILCDMNGGCDAVWHGMALRVVSVAGVVE